MLRLKLILIMLSISYFIGATTAINADDIVGVWHTSNKDAKITIFKNGNYFYGKISWLKKPNTPDGKPKIDAKNPDESLRSRHILGMLLLKGFEYSESEKYWINGEIYDPNNGKSYSCKLTLKDNNTLDVRGFVGISLIGRTETWTRAE